MAQESPEKLRGGFYTSADIADFLARWVSVIQPRRVLEPSCGDGALLEALRARGGSHLETLFACEIAPQEAAKARARPGRVQVEVHEGDFLKWFLWNPQAAGTFDAALGNPPFIRYQYLPKEQQELSERIFHRFGLPFTKHTNAWVPFVIASLALLRPGGRLAMVVPSEIFHIPHAQSLRRFLLEQCLRTLILDPEEIWFGETLQGTVLLLAEKKDEPTVKGQGVDVFPIRTRDQLTHDPEPLFQTASYTNGPSVEGKWMGLFLDAGERALLTEWRAHKQVQPFGAQATVDVGIVTGANDFFLVPDDVVEAFDLGRWAHPMFGRSENVQGLIYSAADHASNRRAGLPSNFLWFQEEELPLSENLRRYLETGLAQRLESRYKCRVRSPWYQVPSVYATPVAMLKRAHHFPRLVLNPTRAYTTDTAYRIQPGTAVAESLVLAFVNSLTCLTAEMEGRHYGGGVLELVPSEIERLLVPVVSATPDELAVADGAFRQGKGGLDFVRQQDAVVLGRIGVSTAQQEIFFHAWSKLRNRRQRVASPS